MNRYTYLSTFAGYTIFRDGELFENALDQELKLAEVPLGDAPSPALARNTAKAAQRCRELESADSGA